MFRSHYGKIVNSLINASLDLGGHTGLLFRRALGDGQHFSLEPLLGLLAVSGAHGEGIFGITFAVQGPLAEPQVWTQMAKGGGATLGAAAVGMVGALVLAVLFAFGRLASSKLIRVPVAIVLEFFRGMPVLLMTLFILLVASTGALVLWA